MRTNRHSTAVPRGAGRLEDIMTPPPRTCLSIDAWRDHFTLSSHATAWWWRYGCRVTRRRTSSSGGLVALKFLPEELVRDQDALERFEREARAASGLNHPHICTVHDLGWTSAPAPQPFIVMERLEGETLKHVIAQGVIPVSRVIETGIQNRRCIGDRPRQGDNSPRPQAGQYLRDHPRRSKNPGLRYRQARHRKPVRRRGGRRHGFHACRVRALDAARSCRRHNRVHVPEQALGEDIDGRSDLFSLGVVLYEMVSGRQPFIGPTTAAIYDAILHRVPRPLADLDPRVMPELSATIARLLEKDRAARYGTAADLKVELVRLKRQLESGPTHADAVVAAGPTRSRRSRVATVTALLAVAVIATWGLFKVSGPRSSAPAEASLDVKQLRIAVGAGRVDDVFAMIQAGKVDLTASGVRDIVAPALGEVTLDSTPPGAARPALHVWS